MSQKKNNNGTENDNKSTGTSLATRRYDGDDGQPEEEQVFLN